MVYLTGDTHGDFRRIRKFCTEFETSREDVLIILGDAGINFYGDYYDRDTKEYILSLPVTFFCIHGNHEKRPSSLKSYVTKEYRGGTVWYEEQYPNILFARDGDIFEFEGSKCLVAGGAYSIDKHYRLRNGWPWFADEQPDSKIKIRTEETLQKANWSVDFVLSHTCPLKYEPTELFLNGIDQSKVDKTTEKWLDNIEDRLSYSKWYCGHWHTDKQAGKIRFMFNDYVSL